MAVITIPFDYDPELHDDSLIPIFLNDTDETGRPVFFGWIEAVIPVQDKLKALTRRVLGDVWRVSELTDVTVQHLWRKYGNRTGPYPSHTLYRAARRKAHGFEDPCAREHCGRNVSLNSLERFQDMVSDGVDPAVALHRNLRFREFEARLRELGTREDHLSFMRLKAGYTWKEIGGEFGERPGTLQRRFRRLIEMIGMA